jgi:electron transfer flavoprotein alpha subunit
MSEIWVIADTRGGRATRGSLQLLGAGGELAEARGGSLVALVIGGGAEPAGELAALATQVVSVEGDGLEPYEASRHLQAIGQLLAARGEPEAILAPASSRGFELLPRLAARLKTGFAGACTALWWGEQGLAARRPVHGGKAYEEIELLMKPAIATVRPGSLDPPNAASSAASGGGGQTKAGNVETFTARIDPADCPNVVDRQTTGTGGVLLTEASAVVAGGRGLGEAANFELIEDLAAVLGGAVGASRSVVDAGWRSHDEQVGKSGQTVSPELYIAAGISGAIHHVLGMNTSRLVVAINKDPGALIFENADLGIVGDALEVLPALTEAVDKAMCNTGPHV